MARVPDTNTFTLINVNDVIGYSSGTLVDCFADADADCFDTTYKGSMDRLSNFRNYFIMYVDDLSFSWTATTVTAQTTTIYTNATPFVIDSYPAWITVRVLEGGNAITNPSLFTSGLTLEFAPSTNTGGARSGTVEISDGSVIGSVSISVSQQAASNPPTVSVGVADGETFTITSSSGSISASSDQLTFQFSGLAGFSTTPTTMPYYILDAGSNTVKTGGLANVQNHPTASYGDTVTISRNAVNGDVFTVFLGSAS